MVSLSDLRSKIANRIFSSSIASSALLASYTSPSTDKWGDEQSAFSPGTSITIVPYIYMNKRLNYQPFGDLREGEIDLVVQHGTTVNERDRITFQNIDYFITEIDHSAWLANGLVVQIVRATKKQVQ